VDFFPIADILIEISQQASTQVCMFWKHTYREMILGESL